MNDKNNFDINFPMLFHNLLSRLWIIILCGVIAASIAYGYVAFMVQPVYSSTATIYIGNSQGYENLQDVNLSGSLAKDYEEIIKRPAVLDKVVEKLGLKMTTSQLRSCVSVVNVTDTRILDITVETPDPALSKNIADAICEVAQDEIVSIIKENYVTPVDEGSINSTPSNINLPLSMIFAAIAGILASVAAITIRTVMDDKIKTPDDIERYLGLSVLGTTPYIKEFGEASSFRKKRTKARNNG